MEGERRASGGLTRRPAQESEQLHGEAEALCALWQQVQRHRVEERAPARSRVRALRWSRARRDYCAAGRSASLVLLQRRWHELKLRARYKLLNYWRTTSECHADAHTDTPACSDPPREIHISILKRSLSCFLRLDIRTRCAFITCVYDAHQVPAHRDVAAAELAPARRRGPRRHRSGGEYRACRLYVRTASETNFSFIESRRSSLERSIRSESV